jgi:16S rRNA (uracil1498-N3)-methyltransferase
MKISRYYIDTHLSDRDMSIKDKNLLHRLSSVLRYKLGEKVILFNGKSEYDFIFSIKDINKKEIYLTFVEQITNNISHSENITSNNINKKYVHAYVAIVKSDFDDMVREMVEVGVGEITPIISDRVERKELNIERLTKIIIEASEQSGRNYLPKLNATIKLSDFNDFSSISVCYHTKQVSQDSPVTQDNELKEKSKINIFIGPEGGWTDSEITWFENNQFLIKTLKTNILRAKTAAVICLYDTISVIQ